MSTTVTAVNPQVKTRITAMVPLVLIQESPLHHGAGMSGNTQRLRTQPARNPWTGETYNSPMISGGSLRHAIRDALAEVTLGAVDATPGTLSKSMVDLLYSGGALTGSEGSNVDLDGHRQLDEQWPPAGLLGYAGRGQIWAGHLYTDILLPVCRENAAWRMSDKTVTVTLGQLGFDPATGEPIRNDLVVDPTGRTLHRRHPRYDETVHIRLQDLPSAYSPVAALREEEFGTRHDIVGSPADRWLDTDMWSGLPPDKQSNQMIFDWQVTRAGTIWYGALRLAAATIGHAQALRVAWDWLTASGTMHLGAKRAQGYGLCRAQADWSALPALDASWVTALHQHRNEVMQLLMQAAGK